MWSVRDRRWADARRVRSPRPAGALLGSRGSRRRPQQGITGEVRPAGTFLRTGDTQWHPRASLFFVWGRHAGDLRRFPAPAPPLLALDPRTALLAPVGLPRLWPAYLARGRLPSLTTILSGCQAPRNFGSRFWAKACIASSVSAVEKFSA
jgi:hypothetical protein